MTPAIESVWINRLDADWKGTKLTVVSPHGLIALKQLRNSQMDLADIAALERGGSDAES